MKKSITFDFSHYVRRYIFLLYPERSPTHLLSLIVPLEVKYVSSLSCPECILRSPVRKTSHVMSPSYIVMCLRSSLGGQVGAGVRAVAQWAQVNRSAETGHCLQIVSGVGGGVCDVIPHTTVTI